MRHGVSSPGALAARAAELGQPALALTDRDGLYGAVRFAQACQNVGINPILGVDLALVSPVARAGQKGSTRRRTPARGGAAIVEPGARVVVLARGGSGWAALCRLVSAAHLTGERGAPALPAEVVAAYACAGDLLVLLGADSPAGQAAGRRRRDVALAQLRWWRDAVGYDSVRVDVASHRAVDAPDARGTVRSSAAAAR